MPKFMHSQGNAMGAVQASLAAAVLAMICAPLPAAAQDSQVPAWIRDTAGFWADGIISDAEFVNAIQYLIENGILDAGTADPYPDRGDFVMAFEPNPNSPYDYTARDFMVETGYFGGEMAFLNGYFKLPYDINVVAKECGIANMYYDWELQEIGICYEFVDSVAEEFATYWEGSDFEATEADIAIATLDVIDFVFYHEIGHALVDVYNLPVTGLEENAVDQFATLFILKTQDESGSNIVAQHILVSVGIWYLAQYELYEQDYYWSVHNLDIQRFYNVSCYAYGENPDFNRYLVDEGWLPEDRAANCEYEYAKMAGSWHELLGPYTVAE